MKLNVMKISLIEKIFHPSVAKSTMSLVMYFIIFVSDFSGLLGTAGKKYGIEKMYCSSSICTTPENLAIKAFHFKLEIIK